MVTGEETPSTRKDDPGKMSKVFRDFVLSEEEAELKKRGYTLGSTIGEGSYAKVKSAYSEVLQKRVAIKIINRRRAPRDFREKFLPRELKILDGLDHPNVIKMYEILDFASKVGENLSVRDVHCHITFCLSLSLHPAPSILPCFFLSFALFVPPNKIFPCSSDDHPGSKVSLSTFQHYMSSSCFVIEKELNIKYAI